MGFCQLLHSNKELDLDVILLLIIWPRLEISKSLENTEKPMQMEVCISNANNGVSKEEIK